MFIDSITDGPITDEQFLETLSVLTNLLKKRFEKSTAIKSAFVEKFKNDWSSEFLEAMDCITNDIEGCNNMLTLVSTVDEKSSEEYLDAIINEFSNHIKQCKVVDLKVQRFLIGEL